ncbi:MAG: phage head-tail connector protein [Alphaproteobacteria bacterium]
MKTILITPPAVEALTVAQVKDFLKITHTQEDDLLAHFITTARYMAETYLRRKLITQRIASILPFRPNHRKKQGLQRVWTVGDRYALFLPRGTFQKIHEVEMISEEGDTVSVPPSRYHVNAHQDPALLVVDDQNGWGVRVTYDVGYGASPTDIPPPLQHALLQMVACLYHQRTLAEGPVLAKVAPLLDPYRLLPGSL